MSVQEHKALAPTSVGCKVITVSDTRTEKTDKSGNYIVDKLKSENHSVINYCIVKDDRVEIMKAIQEGARHPEIQVILLNGGTGISKRDVTYETVQSLLEKEIVGFGELFRMLSYTEDIGASAMLSRAIAGVYENTAIFSMPGSTGAVRLAMEKLILNEIGHVVRELSK
ncbi:MogA/MoaB family molybdenum cofactor biosynthesis protein [Fictibacillus sp. Mic-4]|uniref:MogA/MoaB family molybdenum cofactor biosynthesis protein n=1 Tax=Fictibacillus TaxID=1329200 RepID=UPI0004265566|nr:MogA/MoaB family molybdenum cofactor biosynthesis protein [Fictibacillus gelatini]